MLELALIALSAWFLFGAGEELAARTFHFTPADGIPARRFVILALSLIATARFKLTLFRFTWREVPWAEAIWVPLAFAIYYVGFAILVLPSDAPLDLIDAFGIALFVAGALINTVGEWQRDRFKRRPENQGRLYTAGLFALAMHINFFGDVLWVAGFAVVARSPWGALVPLGLLAYFVFFSVPDLDGYLARRYGEQFRIYAANTKQLVPFVW